MGDSWSESKTPVQWEKVQMMMETCKTSQDMVHKETNYRCDLKLSNRLPW